MNKNINYILTILLLIIVSLSNLKAQEAEILSIDPSEYPKIKTEFKLIGYDDREVRSFTKQDVKLFDNFTEKTDLTLPVCNEADSTNFSALLIVDISNSMRYTIDPNGIPDVDIRRIDVAVSVLNHWADVFDPTVSESAIMTFAASATLLQGMTTNKSKIKSAVVNFPELSQGTNYNAAFLRNQGGDSSNSAVKILESARYTPVIIFMTDGAFAAIDTPGGDADTEFFIQEVEKWAKSVGCHIFVVKIGDTDTQVSYSDLYRLASVQGDYDDYFFDIHFATFRKLRFTASRISFANTRLANPCPKLSNVARW